MLCCTDLFGTDTSTSDRDTISAFPGQRRLVPTGGNALREYNPAVDDVVSNPSSSSSLLLVQVPPGTQPGDIIHVQIPGEDRVIAAQVPPDVSEFHVSYEPSPTPIRFNSSSPAFIQPPKNQYTYTETSSMTNRGSNNYHEMARSYSSPSKMVLVQVPEGAQPGSVIQVQVPGENRVIMAQVPPDAREFYVTIDNTPLNQTPTINPSINRNVVPMDGNRNNSSNVNQQNGNSFGLVAPIVAGAALMGAAGYMMTQHGESETTDDYDDGGGDW